MNSYLSLDHEHAEETHLSDGAVDVEPVVFLDVLNESVQHDEGPGPSDASATPDSTTAHPGRATPQIPDCWKYLLRYIGTSGYKIL